MSKAPSTTRTRLLRIGPAILAVGLPFLIHLLSVYPGVGDREGTGDAIECQLVGRVLSIPHEPGYPQYVLLSHLWSYVPLPVSLATKINLLSAFFSALAGGFFFSAARSLSGNIKASILATWLVLLTPSVWLLSTQAEVYTLNLMWVAAVLWAALEWYDTGDQRVLVALFFFYALSFGNHLMMITLLPGLAYLILARDPKVALRWQNWVWAILAIATGLLQYGLLLWRSYHPHPALLDRFPSQASIGELLEYITGGHFVDRHLLKTGIEGWLPRVWEVFVLGLGEMTLPFALLCGLGTYLGIRRYRQKTFFLALAAASVVAFAAAYGIKDALFYTIPSWFCAGLLGAVGSDWFFVRTRRWSLQIGVIVALLVVSLVLWRASLLRVDDNPTDLESVIAAAPPGSGILAAFKPRRARLLHLYYQYGQVTEKALAVDFHSVNEALATGLENVRDQPLYFRDPRAARVFDDSHIDYRLLATLADGQTLYVTEPEEPLHALELRPLWNGLLAISLRDESLDLLGDGTLHLFLISSRHKRSKGYLTIDTRGNPSWPRQLADALAVGSPGDRFLLVAPRLGPNLHNDLAGLLQSRGLDLRSPTDPQRHTLAWWRVGGPPEDTVRRTDLTETLVLSLDSPTTPEEAASVTN